MPLQQWISCGFVSDLYLDPPKNKYHSFNNYMNTVF